MRAKNICSLNTGIANACSLSAAPITFNAVTEIESPKYVFRLGNVAFLRILTYKTVINANTVLFSLPEGYRPKKKESIRAHFVRIKDGVIGNYPITLNTNGTMVSNFNDDGELWSIDLFYIYTTA